MEIKGFPYEDFEKFVDKFLKGHHSSFSEKEIKSTPETLLKNMQRNIGSCQMQTRNKLSLKKNY